MTETERKMTPVQRRAHERAMIQNQVDAYNRQLCWRNTADIYLELVEHVGGKKAADMMKHPKDVGKERHV